LNSLHYPAFKTQKLSTTYRTQAKTPPTVKQVRANAVQMRPLFGAQRLSTKSTS